MATTTPEVGRVGRASLPPANGRAGIGGALRSELTKLRSVRSTWWTLLALLIVSVGIGAAITGGTAAHWAQMGPGDRASMDPTQISLGGMLFIGQLVVAVLGALAITSEYSTGMIRTSLTAQPRRGAVFAGKAAVFTAVALVVAFVASSASFYLGQALLHSTGHAATLSQAGVMRAVVGTSLYVALCGLFAFTIGTIMRHTAGTITTAIGVLFVLPILAHLLPSEWFADIRRWLPSSAGDAISVTVGNQPPNLFAPWTQLAVFGIYTAVLLVAAATLFRTRDA